MLARLATWWWCLLGMCLLAPMASAATSGELFARGVTAFKSGNFASALQYFQQAQIAGLDLPTLHYNLGVSLYKLGRYADAEAEFRACARDPAWAALANYNAGLAAYQRGQRATAAEYFDRAWRTADSEEVQALALTMLERTDPIASRRARGTLELNLGHNDNVTLVADNQTLQASNKSDQFVELFASATGQWTEGSNTPRWDASLYHLGYAHLTDNNVTDLLLGADQPVAIGQWRTDFAAQWDYALRDGQRFQQIASARVETVRELSNRGDLRASLRASAIHALDPNFAFLDGSRQEFGVSLMQPAASGQMRLGVALERNNREDLTTTSEFFSFSPTRHSLWLKGSWPLATYWRLEPTARYTRSRYADPDRRASGLVETREDNERQLALRARYRLTPVWQLVGEYSYTDNRSNFSEFAYSQHVTSIGISRPF
jgi:tetratricopeptide (TPR) repeat protein